LEKEHLIASDLLASSPAKRYPACERSAQMEDSVIQDYMEQWVPDGLCSSTDILSLWSSSTHHQAHCTPLSGLRAPDGAREGAQADRVSNHGSHGEEL